MLYYISQLVLKQFYIIRGVAQLVERVVWDHEVARSIRVAPTNKKSVENSLYLWIQAIFMFVTVYYIYSLHFF